MIKHCSKVLATLNKSRITCECAASILTLGKVKMSDPQYLSVTYHVYEIKMADIQVDMY